MTAREQTNARTTMAGMKRNNISRRAVEQRRERVLELRLAGLSPASIAEELCKEEVFKHTTEDAVRNDIKVLKDRAKIEEIEYQRIVKEIFQKSRDSCHAILRTAHRRLQGINRQIVRLEELMAEVDEQLQEFGQPLNGRAELVCQMDRLVRLARELRSEERDQMRVIISTNKTLIDMPRKLGLIVGREDAGLYDDMKETMLEAIKNEPDPERQKALIQAAELLGGLL